MLPGFEDITYDLTPDEKDIAREIWIMLQQSPEPMTNAKIEKRLSGKGISTSAPRIRKMIAWMHTEGHLPRLIANSKGYYFAETKQELRDYTESLYGRISAIGARYNQSMKELQEWK